MPRPIEVTGWLPNLLGPIDVLEDGAAVDVPRRQKFNLVGCTIEDESDFDRTKITFTGTGGGSGDETDYLAITETPTGDVDVTGIGVLESASASSTVTINSLTPPAAGKAKRVAIINNNGDGATLVLANDSGYTTEGGFRFAGAGSLTVYPGEAYLASYSHSAQRYVVKRIPTEYVPPTTVAFNAYNNSSQTRTIYQGVIFDTVDVNQGGFTQNGAQTLLTIPESGQYFVSLRLRCVHNAADPAAFGLSDTIGVAGGAYTGACNVTTSGCGAADGDVVDLIASAVITVPDAGATLSVKNTGTSSATLNGPGVSPNVTISIHKLR